MAGNPSPGDRSKVAEQLNILFLCTGNSARSILAEAFANHLATGHVRAFSAGSHPGGAVHPGALEMIEQKGLDGDFRSKSWDEFTGSSAPDIHRVVTLCDNAANEVCPVFPGQ